MKPKIKVGETYPDGRDRTIVILHRRNGKYAEHPFLGIELNADEVLRIYDEFGKCSSTDRSRDLILPQPVTRLRPWTYDEIPLDALLTVPPFAVQFKILGKKLAKGGEALIMTPPDVEGVVLHSVQFACDNYKYKMPGTDEWLSCGVEEEV